METPLLAAAAAGAEIVLAATLASLAFLSWRRTRAPRMLFLPVAFLLLLAQGALLAVALLSGSPDLATAVAWGAVLDCLALLAMYLGLLRP